MFEKRFARRPCLFRSPRLSAVATDKRPSVTPAWKKFESPRFMGSPLSTVDLVQDSLTEHVKGGFKVLVVIANLPLAIHSFLRGELLRESSRSILAPP